MRSDTICPLALAPRGKPDNRSQSGHNRFINSQQLHEIWPGSIDLHPAERYMFVCPGHA